MPVPHLPWQPSPSQLRELALGSTVYPAPYGRMPSAVGSADVIANAAGWTHHWPAAAVYRVRQKRSDWPAPRWVARLVIAVPDRETGRPWWGVATLCSWPV